MSNTKKIKMYSIDEVTDKYIGKRGTPKREVFENELHTDLLGQEIKKGGWNKTLLTRT